MHVAFGGEAVYPDTSADVATLAQKVLPRYVLELSASQRSRFRYFSLHQPAWVAFELADRALRVTVLRDPIERTISHLRQLTSLDHIRLTMEELYEDAAWRRHLADYQTQVFGQRDPRHHPTSGEARPVDVDDLDRTEIERSLQRVFGTALTEPTTVDAVVRARAEEALERYDLVGTTEDLETFCRSLARVTGIDLAPVPHRNKRRSHTPVSRELRQAIADDMAHDLELYEYARQRGARA